MQCGECSASHSTRRNVENVENVGNVQHHIPSEGMWRMWRMWGSPVSYSTRRNACNVENVGNVQHHIPLGGMRAMWRMWGMSSITFHPEECVRCGECGECPASHSTRRNACDVENVGNVQHHIPPGGMRRMWRMSSIALHPEGWLRNRPSDWLIPSGDCAMLHRPSGRGLYK